MNVLNDMAALAISRTPLRPGIAEEGTLAMGRAGSKLRASGVRHCA
jgi:hypothetical protein